MPAGVAGDSDAQVASQLATQPQQHSEQQKQQKQLEHNGSDPQPGGNVEDGVVGEEGKA